MMKLVQITDLHLVPEGQELYGLDPQLRLRACVADINAHHRDAELCVITGDLTQFGDEGAYAVLRHELSSLEVPWQLLVGNHDNRPTFRRFFPEMPVDEHGFVQTSWTSGVGTFLFLDTLEPGLHAGAYCERRQQWLKKQLTKLGEDPVYIFMHHPPMKVGIPSLDTVSLLQKRDFASLLAPFRDNIRHIFFGHVHRPLSGSWHGVSFSAIRGTAHQCWLDFESQQQPPGSHEPPAYGVVLIDEDCVVLHAHDYMDQSRKFPLQSRKGDVGDGDVSDEAA